MHPFVSSVTYCVSINTQVCPRWFKYLETFWYSKHFPCLIASGKTATHLHCHVKLDQRTKQTLGMITCFLLVCHLMGLSNVFNVTHRNVKSRQAVKIILFNLFDVFTDEIHSYALSKILTKVSSPATMGLYSSCQDRINMILRQIEGMCAFHTLYEFIFNIF